MDIRRNSHTPLDEDPQRCVKNHDKRKVRKRTALFYAEGGSKNHILCTMQEACTPLKHQAN